jgi:hypothetical protein
MEAQPLKAKDVRKPPSDLTKLTQANNGTFPLTHVYDVVDGKLDVVIHLCLSPRGNLTVVADEK